MPRRKTQVEPEKEPIAEKPTVPPSQRGRRSTHRGRKYQVGDIVRDLVSDTLVVITGFDGTTGTIVWVRESEDTPPYSLGVRHIRPLPPSVEPESETNSESVGEGHAFQVGDRIYSSLDGYGTVRSVFTVTCGIAWLENGTTKSGLAQITHLRHCRPDELQLFEQVTELADAPDPTVIAPEPAQELAAAGLVVCKPDLLRPEDVQQGLQEGWLAPIEPIEGEFMPSPTEQLLQLEAEIVEGERLRKEGERRIWEAVAVIRSQELWQLHTDEQGNPIYKSFPDYCQQKWGWQKSYAHQIAATGEVVLQLKSTIVDSTLLPDSVIQGTELAKVEPAKRLQVIDQVMEAHGKLTAKAIREVRVQLQTSEQAGEPQAAPEPLPPPPPTPSAYVFIPIEPVPAWFKIADRWIEGQAIARNSKNFVRIVWGEGNQTDVPDIRVRWQPPEPEAEPLTATLRLKFGRGNLDKIANLLDGAIVQIGEQTFVIPLERISLER